MALISFFLSQSLHSEHLVPTNIWPQLVWMYYYNLHTRRPEDVFLQIEIIHVNSATQTITMSLGKKNSIFDNTHKMNLIKVTCVFLSYFFLLLMTMSFEFFFTIGKRVLSWKKILYCTLVLMHQGEHSLFCVPF